MYVSSGRDGMLRVWSPSLKLQHAMPVSEHRDAIAVNGMARLTDPLGKLAVASADRIVTLYELQDHAGSKRWSAYGRISLKDMPISVATWVHVADEAPCLAIGLDSGIIRIFDAKKLVSCFKDDRIRSEAVRGAVPFRHVEHALIITLSLHSAGRSPGLAWAISSAPSSLVT